MRKQTSCFKATLINGKVSNTRYRRHTHTHTHTLPTHAQNFVFPVSFFILASKCKCPRPLFKI